MTTSRAHPQGPSASAVRRCTRAAGLCFLVVGCGGFLPGVTTNLDQLHATGPGSPTALLGVLPVTVAGNVVHLALAVAALLCVGSDARARAYLVGGGAFYALLCARSLVIGTGTTPATPHGGSALWLAMAAGLAMIVSGWLSTLRLQVPDLGRGRTAPPW